MKQRKYKDITNQKFDKLLAIRYIKNDKQGNAIWQCKCDCGKMIEVLGASLRRKGNTVSCGCYHSHQQRIKCQGRYNGGKYISGFEYGGIKYSAKRRKIDFNLSILEIENQFEKQNFKCFYSGMILRFDIKNAKGNFIRPSGTASVDRIDSSKGYTADNIHIVHKDVNLMKQQLSVDRFLDYIRLISQNKKNDMVKIQKYNLIIDIDGTIFTHLGTLEDIACNPATILPGVKEKFEEWNNKGYHIMLTTARSQCLEKLTRQQLADFGLKYDRLIMEITNYPRVLINDRKPYTETPAAQAFIVERDKGLKDFEI